ncbi:Serine/threonine protein kinase [Actinomadura meyerae]|uniref:non-specific serine/threonine protein kinase n=1 Tax=Actinomadura meyerae TaxID=240840 RepID=A0A239N7H4_9ACTN|nr:serine/threonine-protein kinase [Actinomadura meyerae]SNT50394.1 Serine/threonine protein kinase [Actinomadura meyerae]
MTSPKTVIDGRFELRDRLGSGGMGTVWRAFDLALEREVALKEVRLAEAGTAELDPDVARMLRERVMREARALARLDHPNVVTIHHIVDSPDMPHPWLVMELVRGESLHDRLARGPLNPAEAAAVGRGLLAALRAAHEAGICHRDVKPANVLLRADGSPVLTDFGIAVLQEASRVTATGGLVGSPEYIAPERLNGHEGDPASDLWSLGLLLYVAVEGTNPLRRSTTAATLAAIMTAQVPPPRNAGALAPVLQALLVPEPAARPAADQLDAMLAQAAGQSPTHLSFTPGQGPGPASSHGPAPGSSPGSAPGPGPRTAPGAGPRTHPVPPAPPRRRSRAGLIALIAAVPAVILVAAIIGTVFVVLPGLLDEADNAGALGGERPETAPTDSLAETGAGATAKEPSTLLTPAAIRDVIKKFADASGSKEFAELTVYPQRASADAPVAGRRGAFDNYTYEKGADAAVRSRPSIAITTGDAKVNPATFAWDALPALMRRAERTLKVPEPTNRYVIVKAAWTFNGDQPTMMIYLTDDYGGGYLAVNRKGKVIKTVPSSS